MNTSLFQTSLAFLFLFALLSILDGVYLHLIKYRLQENPDSRQEHLMHTLRAFLFIPTTLLLFYWNTSGTLLWILLGLIALDLVFEAGDVLAERKSRETLGGLSSGEYLLHVVLTTTRIAALTLALASKPLAAWQSNISLPPYSDPVRFLTSQLIPGAVLILALHIALIYKPNLISTIEEKLRKRRPQTK